MPVKNLAQRSGRDLCAIVEDIDARLCAVEGVLGASLLCEVSDVPHAAALAKRKRLIIALWLLILPFIAQIIEDYWRGWAA